MFRLAGWKYDELSTKLLRNNLIYYFGISRLLILACLFEAKRSSNYRTTSWSYNLGQNHEKLNSKPTPSPLTNHGWKRAKAKMHHFPILVWRGGGINFPSISYKHRRQPGGILNTQDCAMKFLPQAAQYYGHLWRRNYDDKLVRVSGIFSRPGSVTSLVLTKS